MYSIIQEWADMKLNVHMYIQEFHGKMVDRKRRPVLLLGMDTQAITFLSDLNLPVSSEMLIGLDVEDQHVCVRLHARLQWKQPFGEAHNVSFKLAYSARTETIYNWTVKHNAY